MTTYTRVNFRCPHCAETVDESIVVPDVDWHSEFIQSKPPQTPELVLRKPFGLDELITEGYSTVSCKFCSSVFKLYVQNYAHKCFVDLREMENVYVECEPAGFPQNAYDAKFWDKGIPQFPITSLALTIIDIASTIATTRDMTSPVRQTILRMSFAQIIAALEAYLSETFVEEVMRSRTTIHRIVTTTKELSAKKFTLAEVFHNPKIVEDETRCFMLELLYHNLPKVDGLFANVLGFPLFGQKDDGLKDRLISHVNMRHNIVHRNGKTKDGIAAMVSEGDIVQLVGDLVLLSEIVAKGLAKANTDAPAALSSGTD
jgi:hypothetical protein